ncbi:MAG: DUF255 domain-containing protein, partial [Acidobacteriota bacterium]
MWRSSILAGLLACSTTVLAAVTTSPNERPPKNSLNQLAREKSPYLLQHASDPVAWLPWGEEAFRKAREENKPVFLSIGYSSCHWCHVMREESFSNK